ncbi:hypothetical protein MLOOGBEN_06750 [Bacillus sp. EB106-08-02-XG196]|uniref:DUF3800 domain-containing protein n=1 Tax=Bacillus sp. EB106-08-02-XG196 TaxID=2737049 RepID=UPI0015C4402E|nr:DUF3800 domain-containing protein [Bacillus sp. EB106-08-02-XG196]NWQ40397.1 hypothetical protein [Bacillus sp. EB106-08-02-XG196]
MVYGYVREQLIEFYKSIDNNLNFDVNYTFYYDETNNCRIFRIKDGKLNVDKNKDYILGGVALDKEIQNINDNFIELRNKLHIQSNLKEVKFKNLCGQGSNFLKCISSNKIKYFLSWLLEKDIYIHYQIFDNLYYSLVDIIDSLETFSNLDVANYYKTLLYRFVYANTEVFIKIFEKHKYPNISEKDSVSFYEDLIKSIKGTTPESLSNKNELISLIETNKMKIPIFLLNNTDLLFINEYKLLYEKNIYMFNQSYHYFDEEHEVQKQMQPIRINNKLLTNYEFKKSHENIYIQLSDIIVGLLGKLIEFIKPIRNEDIEYVYASLNDYQKDGLELLIQILHKSYNKNGALRNSSMNLDLNYKFDKLMRFDSI